MPRPVTRPRRPRPSASTPSGWIEGCFCRVGAGHATDSFTACAALGRWQTSRALTPMPKRTDLESILIIGAGPIIIGQACEFDYSGTQACKALREEGYQIVLVNSNPATIMTDPELADRTYIEPLTTESVRSIIKRERPDALLPTVGGQTALNIAVELAESGILDEYKVETIGAKAEAVKMAEDRLLFKEAMADIGLATPRSEVVGDIREALRVIQSIGFPAVIRPSFTLGGTGGGIAF